MCIYFFSATALSEPKCYLFKSVFVFLFVDPPTLNKTLPQNETLCLHKSVALRCAASSGFPTPQLTLYNGSSILTKTNLSQLSHTITISSAADFKQYHCEASNLVGSDRVNITVNPVGEWQFHSITSCQLNYAVSHWLTQNPVKFKVIP